MTPLMAPSLTGPGPPDRTTMKAGLFARPNLKMFVVAAIMIVAVDHFLSENSREDNSLFLESTLTASPPADDELQRLIELSLQSPTSDNLILVSECFRRRGETKRAMHYLRKANIAAHLEE